MEGKPHGKLWPIYKEMAAFVKTRNYRQCKSHHQKMVVEHGTIFDIILYLQKFFPALVLLIQKEKENLQGKVELEPICQNEKPMNFLEN